MANTVATAPAFLPKGNQTAEALFFSYCETYFDGKPEMANPGDISFATARPGLSPQLCAVYNNNAYFYAIANNGDQLSLRMNGNQRKPIHAPTRNNFTARSIFFNKTVLSEHYSKTVTLNDQDYHVEAERRWETPNSWMPFGFRVMSEPDFFVTITDSNNRIIAQFDKEWNLVSPWSNPSAAIRNTMLASALIAASCPSPQPKRTVSIDVSAGPLTDSKKVHDLVICK